jgi:hypothetical protein
VRMSISPPSRHVCLMAHDPPPRAQSGLAATHSEPCSRGGRAHQSRWP